MLLDPHYWLYKEAVDNRTCDLIVERGNELELTAGIAGGELQPDTRKSQIGWFPKGDWVELLIADHMKRGNPWEFILHDTECVQFTQYGLNEFYKPHMDTFKLEDGMRKVSAVLQLSNPLDYEGGRLMLQDTNSGEYYEPEGFEDRGSIIVFPSILLHQVTPVTVGMRHSAVAWAIGPQFK